MLLEPFPLRHCPYCIRSVVEKRCKNAKSAQTLRNKGKFFIDVCLILDEMCLTVKVNDTEHWLAL